MLTSGSISKKLGGITAGILYFSSLEFFVTTATADASSVALFDIMVLKILV